MEEGDIFEDDPIVEGDDATRFVMRVTREEKLEAKCPWLNNLTSKWLDELLVIIPLETIASDVVNSNGTTIN